MKTSLLAACALVVGCSAPEMDTEAKGETTSRQARGGSSNGTIYAEGMSARVRAGTSTSAEIVGSVADGSAVQVDCWKSGESIDGNSKWDYVPSEGGYVADALVQLSGTVSECSATEPNDAKSAPPASGDFRQGLVAEAHKYLGTKATGQNCNPFTPQVSDMSCRPWCADFVHVVWRNAGANDTNLNGASISFYEQAMRVPGAWKEGAYAEGVQPGDAVVWANERSYGEHVGMVTAVSGDSITVIHGNFWATADNGSVYESTISRSSDAGTGAPIIGYASPRAAR